MILKSLAWWFKIKGWKLGPNLPSDIKKCVVIAAPHTSNWDFVYSMAALYLFGIPVRYLAKKELFNGPLGWIVKSTGGIAVERSKNTGLVEAIVDKFNSVDQLVLLIAGEGTRGKVDKWKSGFYHVAMQADVPVMLAYLDYAKKEAGIGPALYPSGNKEKDAEIIKAFYQDKTARNPENFDLNTIRF